MTMLALSRMVRRASLRGIAIIGVAAERTAESVVEALEFEALVFGKGFGGEEKDGAGAGGGEDFVNDGEVVAESFAAGGGGDDDDVLAGEG